MGGRACVRVRRRGGGVRERGGREGGRVDVDVGVYGVRVYVRACVRGAWVRVGARVFLHLGQIAQLEVAHAKVAKMSKLELVDRGHL